LPSDYGHGRTIYNRHRRWSAEGTGAKVLNELRRGGDQSAQAGHTVEWLVGVDSPVIRAPQHAAGAPLRRRLTWPWPTSWAPRQTQGAGSNDQESSASTDREALGRSRGGLSTKVHFATDQRCPPISRVITPGQRHDSLAFAPVMAGVRIGRRGPGRPAYPSRQGAGRQGLLHEGYPVSPAQTQHQDHHPRAS
jgi:hypothetical protein